MFSKKKKNYINIIILNNGTLFKIKSIKFFNIEKKKNKN